MIKKYKDPIVIPRQLLEDLRHELACTSGLHCTDRPAMVSQEAKQYFFRLDNTKQLKEVDKYLDKKEVKGDNE